MLTVGADGIVLALFFGISLSLLSPSSSGGWCGGGGGGKRVVGWCDGVG